MPDSKAVIPILLARWNSFNQKSLRVILALLPMLPFVCLTAVFTVDYTQGLFVRGDSFQAYAAFNYAYDNVLSAGEFPQWLPYAAYGSPAEPYTMTFLGPFHILAIMCGAFLNIHDAWLLFYCTTFLECMVFIGGAFILAAELYESRTTASIVATWIAVSLYWNWQIFWPHRVLLYVPLILFFTLRFHRTGDVRDALRAGLVTVISLIGNLVYLAPVYAFMICLFSLLLRIADRENAFARLQWPHWPAVLEFALLVLVGAGYVLLFHNAFSGAILVAPERDPVSGVASLETFLTYGGSALEKLPEFILGHYVGHLEFLFYLGVIATGFVLFALRRVRSGVFWALTCLTICLLLLSLGPHGLLGYVVYWFPLMNRFRHLSFLLPLIRVLLLFLAGYGLDRFLCSSKEYRKEICLWLSLTSAVMIALKWAFTSTESFSGLAGFIPEFSLGILLLALAIGLCYTTRLPQLLGLLLGLCVAIELGIANHILLVDGGGFNLNYGRYPGDNLDVRAVQHFPFQANRFTPESVVPRAQALVALAARQSVNNFLLFQFVGADPCVPVFRLDYAMPNVVEMLNRAAPNALSVLPRSDVDPRKALFATQWESALSQPWFREACGCDDGKLVLETPQGERLDLSTSVRHFSANRLVVDVDGGSLGGHIYYADAFHPGWKVLVDGQASTVAKARGAFKMVTVPPGNHQVALSFYAPLHEWTRRILAMVSCLVMVTIFVTNRHLHRKLSE